MSRLILFAALAASFSACPLTTGDKVCTADLEFGLSVHVKDSTTTAWAASGAKTCSDASAVIDSIALPSSIDGG